MNGVHKYYDKRLYCQTSECVSQSYPAKSNNLWSTQVTMTNVYIVNHLNVFHSLTLQNLATYGAHKYYDKHLHCQAFECVSQSNPAKSNNLWSPQVLCQISECVSQSYPAKSNNLWSTQVL